MNSRTLRAAATSLLALAVMPLVNACPQQKSAPGSGPGTAQSAPVVKDAARQSGLPEGWPVPELGLPPGASLLPEAEPVEGRAFSPGSREWSVQFSYANDWPAAIAHCESTLKALGWSRVGGSQQTIDPLPRAQAEKERRHSEGKRLFVAPDDKRFVYLYYDGRPSLHSQALEETYKLQVIVFEQPQSIGPPSYKEAL